MISQLPNLEEALIQISRGGGQVPAATVSLTPAEQRLHQRGSLLSARECRVLSEISRGASNKQVARLLEISPSTVRTHVESIFRKLGCSTRAAATLKGAALGLISCSWRAEAGTHGCSAAWARARASNLRAPKD